MLAAPSQGVGDVQAHRLQRRQRAGHQAERHGQQQPG